MTYLRETDLFSTRDKHYSPKTGRFISEDPIGFAGDNLNMYGYVNNNPVLFRDPKGLDKEILQNPSSKYGHQTIHIYDPTTPGNHFYGDFYPPNVSDLELLLGGDLPGRVDTDFDGPGDRNRLGEPISQDRQQDARDISQILDDQQNPPDYNAFRYNCRDYASGILSGGN